MSFFDFDDIFGDFDIFNKDFIKRIQKEMKELEEATKNGKLDGKWDFKEIDRPSVKGFVIRGFFSSDKPLEPMEPLDPLKPLRRRPPLLSATPIKIPKDEIREPLTDVIEEEKAVKVYVELPGEEENDIITDFAGGKLEVKAKNFHKTIDLPTEGINTRKVESKYKNGVLEITILKKKLAPLKPDYKSA